MPENKRGGVAQWSTHQRVVGWSRYSGRYLIPLVLSLRLRGSASSPSFVWDEIPTSHVPEACVCYRMYNGWKTLSWQKLYKSLSSLRNSSAGWVKRLCQCWLCSGKPLQWIFQWKNPNRTIKRNKYMIQHLGLHKGDDAACPECRTEPRNPLTWHTDDPNSQCLRTGFSIERNFFSHISFYLVLIVFYSVIIHIS